MADAAGPRRSVPARLARGARGAVVAPHHLATAAGLSVLAAGGHAVDAAIATNAVLGVVMPNGCGIGGDAFWLVWDEAAGEQVGAQRLRAGAARRVGAEALRDRGLDRIPLRGPLGDHRPRRGPLVGRRARAAGAGCRATPSSPPAIEHAEAGFPAWDGLVVRDRPDVRRRLGREPWTAGLPERLAAARPGAAPGRAGPRSRPSRARCGRSRTRASTPTTTASWASGSRTGSRRPASPITLDDLREQRSRVDHADRDRPTAASRVTTHPPNSSGLVALEILNVLGRFEPPSAPGSTAAAGPTPAWIHLPARGGQARLRRSRRPPRRPGLPRRPRRSGSSASDHAAALAARIDPDRARTPPRRRPACSSAARSTSPSSTPTATP